MLPRHKHQMQARPPCGSDCRHREGLGFGVRGRTRDGDAAARSLHAGADVDDVQAVVVRAVRLKGRAHAVDHAAVASIGVSEGSTRRNQMGTGSVGIRDASSSTALAAATLRCPSLTSYCTIQYRALPHPCSWPEP